MNIDLNKLKKGAQFFLLGRTGTLLPVSVAGLSAAIETVDSQSELEL
jgi:hypothetical protein